MDWERCWKAVLERVHHEVPTVAALLEKAQASEPDRKGRIAILLPPGHTFQVELLGQPRRRKAIEQALEYVIGRKIIADFVGGGGDASPAPAVPASESEPLPDSPQPDAAPVLEAEEAVPEPVEPKPAKKAKKNGKKKAKAKDENEPRRRDPLADLVSDNIRYELSFKQPPQAEKAKLDPWWDRRPKRDAVKRRLEKDAQRESEPDPN